jgi:hypothetical protein
MKTEVGLLENCYQSIYFDKLFCWQVSFSGPKWTPHHEGSIDVFSVLSTL